ncbi:hypothetical protein BU15DRAFT_63874 [Melanogaster broomeanus]|nr:hypothetical protein BU15DRAFT_63874 [Melanogaster broomeanus]
MASSGARQLGSMQCTQEIRDYLSSALVCLGRTSCSARLLGIIHAIDPCPQRNCAVLLYAEPSSRGFRVGSEASVLQELIRSSLVGAADPTEQWRSTRNSRVGSSRSPAVNCKSIASYYTSRAPPRSCVGRGGSEALPYSQLCRAVIFRRQNARLKPRAHSLYFYRLPWARWMVVSKQALGFSCSSRRLRPDNPRYLERQRRSSTSDVANSFFGHWVLQWKVLGVYIGRTGNLT